MRREDKRNRVDMNVPKIELESFLRAVSNFSEIAENHRRLVELFAYFLTERLGEVDVTPRKIKACYDAALISHPANVTDVMKKSQGFVKTAVGAQLRRDAKARIQSSLESVPSLSSSDPRSPAAPIQIRKTGNVVVIHGRDSRIRDSMFQFLRSVALNPIEWNEAVRRTHQGSPYTGQVVSALFQDAQAIVVLLTPEERVSLRKDLQSADSDSNQGWQPRPNVFLECGMALSLDESHTILVQIGKLRATSDLLGRNVVNLDDSSKQRHTFVERLRTAGCDIRTVGTDWLNTGRFQIPSRSLKA